MEFSELCFIWGAPLSNQKKWMQRSADYTPEHITTLLLPLAKESPQEDLSITLNKALLAVQAANKSPNQSTHIYCELPWSLVYESEILEEWLDVNKTLFDKTQNAHWNLSFLCLVPEDADRLPAEQRLGLEELSRATSSTVIVTRAEEDPSPPEWMLESERLDFGKRLEILAEKIWDKEETIASLEPLSENPNITYLEDDAELTSLTVQVTNREKLNRELVAQLWDRKFGDIWGIELYWISTSGSDSKTSMFKCLNITQGHLYEWDSDHASMLQIADGKFATLNIVGVDLETEAIKSLVSSQTIH